MLESIARIIKDNAPLNRSEILDDLIKERTQSDAYKQANIALNYYKGAQDIKSIDFQTTTVLEREQNEFGEWKEVMRPFTNPNRSNHRTQHRFLYNHIEQKVSYLVSKEPSIQVDGAQASEDGTTGNPLWQYQNDITKTTDSYFQKKLIDWCRQASIGGVSWLHEYKDSQGRLKQVVIPALEGIPIYDPEYQEELIEFIRFYPITIRTSSDKEEKYYKVEWWTSQDVTYYVQTNGGYYKLDPDRKINPSPHFITSTLKTDGTGKVKQVIRTEGKAWGKVPFIELKNNSYAMTDLAPYKDLIDAYDYVASKGTNNLMDFNEFYVVLQGLGAETASAVVKLLEVNRAIQTNSPNGSVDMKQYSLEMTGRIDWLKTLWDNIHFFGQVVDITTDKLGNASSGKALEFQYSLLDMKANAMALEVELALKEHFYFVTKEIHKEITEVYNPEHISINCNKSKITNNAEIVDMIIKSQGIVPERILLQAHPLVYDADQAYKDILQENADRVKRQSSIFGGNSTLDEEDEQDNE